MWLTGPLPLKPNDEWQTSGRYMMAGAFARVTKEKIDPPLNFTKTAA